MSPLIIELIVTLVEALVKSGVFERVEASVARWEQQEITSLEKKNGVLAELELVGLDLSDSMANLLIELAVTKAKASTDAANTAAG